MFYCTKKNTPIPKQFRAVFFRTILRQPFFCQCLLIKFKINIYLFLYCTLNYIQPLCSNVSVNQQNLKLYDCITNFYKHACTSVSQEADNFWAILIYKRDIKISLIKMLHRFQKGKKTNNE